MIENAEFGFRFVIESAVVTGKIGGLIVEIIQQAAAVLGYFGEILFGVFDFEGVVEKAEGFLLIAFLRIEQFVAGFFGEFVKGAWCFVETFIAFENFFDAFDPVGGAAFDVTGTAR